MRQTFSLHHACPLQKRVMASSCFVISFMCRISSRRTPLRLLYFLIRFDLFTSLKKYLNVGTDQYFCFQNVGPWVSSELVTRWRRCPLWWWSSSRCSLLSGAACPLWKNYLKVCENVNHIICKHWQFIDLS